MSNVTSKPHPFYPLILFCERINPNGSKSRWIEMNEEVGKHHSLLARHILYGRQLGKLLAHRRKHPMELPYSVSLNCITSFRQICPGEICRAEIEELHAAAPYWDSKTAKKPASVDAEQIMDAELEERLPGVDA